MTSHTLFDNNQEMITAHFNHEAGVLIVYFAKIRNMFIKYF